MAALAVATAAGSGLFLGGTASATTVPTLSIVAGTGTGGPPTAGTATASDLNLPYGVVTDAAGDVYIADSSNNVVEKVTPAGVLSIVAGTGTFGAPVAGPATSSPLPSPGALAMDSAGNLYIGDELCHIEKVTPSGALSIIAGNGTCSNAIPGPALSSPLSIVDALATDASGDLYVGMSQIDHRVLEITPAGTLSVFAGNGTSGAPVAGPALSSPLGIPRGLAVDPSGNVYIADANNLEVAKVTPNGTLSVFAGNGGSGSPIAGPATSTSVHPAGLATDWAGDVYIADFSYNGIEEVTPSGTLSILAGTGTPGVPTPGPATASELHLPLDVATDTVGDVYIADALNNLVEEVSGAFSLQPAPTPSSSGYWTVAGDGGVFSFGPNFYGSTGNLKLNQPVVAMTSTTDGKGYWFVAKDGGVFSYGDAGFHGSVPALGEHVTNIVGMTADTATGGYWLVGSDGGVFAFGAPFDGSVPGLGQHVSNVVGIAGTADGGGYYLVSSTGAVYAFGDAKYQGGANTLTRINAPIVGITVDSATGGYWEAGSDGGVFAFGAPFRGSAGGTTLNQPVVGIAATDSGSGYDLVAADGGVFSYNAHFRGSMGGKPLNAPMVGIAVEG